MHHLHVLLPSPIHHHSLLPYPFKSHAHNTTSSITPNSSPKQPLVLINNNNKNNNKNPSHHPILSSQSQSKLLASRIKINLQKGQHQSCLSLYQQMLDEQITPSPTTLSHVVKACSYLSDLRTLRLLHNIILHLKLEFHLSVAAALLDGYFKCGFPEAAHLLFEKMHHRDIVCWTIVISQCSKRGKHEKAIGYFRSMMDEGISPDEVALISILSALTNHGSLRLGTEVHGYLVRKCFTLSKAAISSLVNTYAKLGKLDYANRVISQAVEKNVVAWTALMTSLVKMHDLDGALTMYQKMVILGIEPTEKSISCALRAVTQLGFLHLGTQIHGYVIKREFELDEYILSGLIDMYNNCGAPTHLCRRLFDQMVVKDVVLWTSMILAHGRQEEGPASLQLFDDMIAAGVCPDSVTFTAILSACCSSGMLHEGLERFNSMIVDYGIVPREEHYSCLTGLIAKDGRLEEAYEAIGSMGLRNDGGIWEAFLGACRIHGNVGYGEIAARKLFEIDPSNCSAYSVLSHIYSAVGRWEDADNMMIRESEVTNRKVNTLSC